MLSSLKFNEVVRVILPSGLVIKRSMTIFADVSFKFDFYNGQGYDDHDYDATIRALFFANASFLSLHLIQRNK